jgi:hypothetical protein
MSSSPEAALSSDAPDSLVSLVAQCSGVSSVVLDERYTLTAIVATRRRTDMTVQIAVVEFMDYGSEAGQQRWAVAAHDELRDLATPTSIGPTAKLALGRIEWFQLDR